ncbi:MAG: hypothetical protein M0R66_06065 [Candidatus Omnitrophica bacterium]|nr:hypothetical protein [Candidatus Omnitrophota bacterium]
MSALARQSQIFRDIRQEALDWCKGKNWQWRLLILAWFAYVLFRHLNDPMYNSILGALNLGIHELGHFVFGFFGNFLGVLGGTLLQCFVPVLSVANFYRQRDFFAIALSFGWLSTNFFDVARYIADARAMELPLVSPFGMGVIHDWNHLLGRMGLLEYDHMFSFSIKVLAVISMLACLVAGGWLIWQMKLQKEEN